MAKGLSWWSKAYDVTDVQAFRLSSGIANRAGNIRDEGGETKQLRVTPPFVYIGRQPIVCRFDYCTVDGRSSGSSIVAVEDRIWCCVGCVRFSTRERDDSLTSFKLRFKVACQIVFATVLDVLKPVLVGQTCRMKQPPMKQSRLIFAPLMRTNWIVVAENTG